MTDRRDWLIGGGRGANGSPGKAAGSKRGKDASSRWLAVPEPDLADDLEGDPDAAAMDGRDGRRSSRSAPKRKSRGKIAASARERRLMKKLDQARDRLTTQANQIGGLERRVAELESALEDQTRRHAVKGRANGATRRGSFDINAATFEQLRDLGLSVTQTARVIGHRETSGGFSSEAELRNLSGLSKHTLSKLIEASSFPKARRSRAKKKA